MSNKGLLIVFSGPSGVGKGTILHEYLASHERAHYSVSATTRTPRPGEEHGREYFFYSKDTFEQLIAQNGVLEYAQYSGNYYGTPRGPVEQALGEGRDVILEIEVQGAQKVLKDNPNAVSIFVMPPSMRELTRRLVDRGTEDEATVRRRLDAAVQEIGEACRYDFIVVNETVEEAVREMDAIVEASRFSIKARREFIGAVLADVCRD